MVPGGDQTVTVNIERVSLRGLQPGVEVPDFTAQTLDGKTLKLSDLRGKVVLIDFWAPWCAPCVGQLAAVRRLNAQYAADGNFTVLSVGLDHRQSIERFLGKHPTSWSQIAQDKQDLDQIPKLYGVSAIPAFFLIGPDGKLIAKNADAKSLSKDIRRAISRIKSVPPTGN